MGERAHRPYERAERETFRRLLWRNRPWVVRLYGLAFFLWLGLVCFSIFLYPALS
jgi:hypothetical protein